VAILADISENGIGVPCVNYTGIWLRLAAQERVAMGVLALTCPDYWCLTMHCFDNWPCGTRDGQNISIFRSDISLYNIERWLSIYRKYRNFHSIFAIFVYSECIATQSCSLCKKIALGIYRKNQMFLYAYFHPNVFRA
jgi:hypothetical protein